MLAQAHITVIVREYEGKVHLYHDKQRVEIPYDNGSILFQRNPVSRGYSAESGNALTVQAACLLINLIIIRVIKETRHKGKGEVCKFFYDPVVPFRIVFLQLHRHSLRRIPHNHCDRNALTISHRPSRFHAIRSEIRFVKRIEIGKIVLSGKGFFSFSSGALCMAESPTFIASMTSCPAASCMERYISGFASLETVMYRSLLLSALYS